MKTYCRQEISRGDIYYADLRPVIGSEQGGIRPVLILQNNVGNRHSPTVIAAPITSKMGKPRLPNLANRFVGELMEQLVQDGLLVTTKTRNGPGVRTATDAEISSPLPGQQQMTL